MNNKIDFDKFTQALKAVTPCESEEAAKQISFLKTILSSAVLQCDIRDSFINDFIEDESVTLIHLTHFDEQTNIRITADFKGELVVADVPLEEGSDHQDVYGYLQTDGVLNITYKGETTAITLDENIAEDLSASADNEFEFPSGVAGVVFVKTEKSGSPNIYMRQKFMELMEDDPLFAFSTFVSTGDITRAFTHIESLDVDYDIFRRDIAFLLANPSLTDDDISTIIKSVDRLGITALIDDLSPMENAFIMSQILAKNNAWEIMPVEAIIKTLIRDASPSNINLLLSSVESLSHSLIPENVLPMIRAEIANCYIADPNIVRPSRLKL